MDGDTFNEIVQLVNEAIKRTVQAGKPYELALQPAFTNMLDILYTPAASTSQRTLLLAAAQRPIAEAETRIGHSMVHDSQLSIAQNSELVRIRAICYELRPLMRAAIDEIKQKNSRLRINQ